MLLEVDVRIMIQLFNIYENSFIKATNNVNKEYETKILDEQIRGDDKDNLSNTESDVSNLVKLRKDYSYIFSDFWMLSLLVTVFKAKFTI